MSEKRNIVLITLDSLRADHCSFMGYHRETTPTIDKMARRGLYFENAIAASVPTGPSMFACFTGDFALIESSCVEPSEWRRLLSRKRTLAQKLQELGYITMGFHANPWLSHYFGFNKGFSIYMDLVDASDVKIIDSKGFVKYLSWMKRFIKKESLYLPWEKYYDYLIDQINLYKKKNKDKPYFIWILLLDTHVPYTPPKKFKKWSKIGSIQSTFLWWKSGRKKLTEKEIKKLIDAYDDTIFYADNFIKKLWNDLETDDPVFIIHADHGDGFGEHGFFQHPPELYEELIHIPFVIYNADVKGKVTRPVPLLRMSSIILDIVNDSLNDSSLSKYTDDWVISKVIKNNMREISIRTNRWKYIFKESSNKVELYDLYKDLYEQNDLSNDYSDLSKEFKKIVYQHIKQEKLIKNISEVIYNIKHNIQKKEG